jgi:hypothetical protein
MFIRIPFNTSLFVVVVVALGCGTGRRDAAEPEGTDDTPITASVSLARVRGTIYLPPGAAETNGKAHGDPVVDAVVYLAASTASFADERPPAEPVIVRVHSGRVEPALSCVVVGQKVDRQGDRRQKVHVERLVAR